MGAARERKFHVFAMFTLFFFIKFPKKNLKLNFFRNQSMFICFINLLRISYIYIQMVFIDICSFLIFFFNFWGRDSRFNVIIFFKMAASEHHFTMVAFCDLILNFNVSYGTSNHAELFIAFSKCFEVNKPCILL